MSQEPTTLFAPPGAPNDKPEPTAGRLPVVTLTLGAVNVLLWLAVLLVGGVHSLQDLFVGDRYLPTLILFGAKVNSLIQEGQYWRLISPMFLHLNLIHLAVNSYSLLLLGGFLERLYGRRRFLIIYVMSGIAGNVASYLMSPGVSVGASTSLFGLLGATIVFWWKHRRLMAPEFRRRMGNSLFAMLFLNLALGASFSIIDQWGHIGGLLGGLGIGAMAESRVAGEAAREREWLPVPLALATVVALLVYTGASVVQNLSVQRPILLAQAAVARGNYGVAVAELQRAVARKPRDPGLRMALAQTLVQARRWSEAAALYRDLLRERPNDSVLLNDSLQLAGGLMEAKRWDESAALYRQLLLTQPNDPGLLNNLAYLYADGPKTHMDEALQMAQRATNLAPQVGTFWDTLAWVYFQRRQWDDAYRAQREAVLLVPDEHVVRYHMGAIQEARGETAAAREEYRQALKLEPTFAPARAALRRLEPAPARATGAALTPRPADVPAA
jgi:rhomboid protease GluP